MAPVHRAPLPRALVALTALALGLAGCASSPGESATVAEVPSFAAPLVGGGELSSADLEGTDAVLWFWAPWCTVCRAEAPDVAETAEAYEDEDMALVGVAGRGELDEMAAFVAETGVEGIDHIADLDGSIWAGYEVVSQPAFAFVDDDDGTVEVHVGALGADGLSDRIDDLLAS